MMTGRSRDVDAASHVWQRELWVASANREHTQPLARIAQSGVEQQLKQGRWRTG